MSAPSHARSAGEGWGGVLLPRGSELARMLLALEAKASEQARTYTNQKHRAQVALLRGCGGFETGEIGQRPVAIASAHLHRRPQRGAERRSLRLAEQLAAQLLVQLHARHPGRLPPRHAGNRRGDRRRDAAGGASGAAFEGLGVHDRDSLIALGKLRFRRYSRADGDRVDRDMEQQSRLARSKASWPGGRRLPMASNPIHLRVVRHAVRA